jgi:hypothetical protein
VTVTITSEVFGKLPGETYTGPMEAWLLSEGYAKQAGYTGAGVSNTGAADTTPANDPRLAANREAPYFPGTADRDATIANDATHLTQAKHPNPEFDLDAGGVDTESPSDLVLDPTSLPLGGGEVHATGTNLEGVTGVTVGGTAATGLDTDNAGDGVITFVAPAKAAGSYDVVFVDASGNTTVTGGLTYAA